MIDFGFIVSVFLAILMFVTGIQQFRIVRLRRKIERMLEAAALKPALVASPAASPEMDQLRKRIQVLERIATDGSPALERELEDLRRAG